MLTLVTPPALEPLSLDTAKLHLRVDFADDDTLITALIAAARLKCESYLSRSFVTTAWALSLDGFPGQYSRFAPSETTTANGSGPLYGYVPERYLAGTYVPIVVPKARLIAVQSITYVDTNGDPQTLDPSLYSVEPGDGGRISPTFNRVWPAARVYPGSVTIAFTMGYGDTAADVPATITQAMLLCLGHWYAGRAAASEAALHELPLGAKWLMASEDWGARP